jgi:chromosome segregation ATPase
MVQLLLVLNLLGIFILFLFLVNLYTLVRALERKYEELEKEVLKTSTSLSELSAKVEQFESKLSFLQRELRLIAEKLGIGRV